MALPYMSLVGLPPPPCYDPSLPRPRPTTFPPDIDQVPERVERPSPLSFTPIGDDPDYQHALAFIQLLEASQPWESCTFGCGSRVKECNRSDHELICLNSPRALICSRCLNYFSQSTIQSHSCHTHHDVKFIGDQITEIERSCADCNMRIKLGQSDIDHMQLCPAVRRARHIPFRALPPPLSEKELAKERKQKADEDKAKAKRMKAEEKVAKKEAERVRKAEKKSLKGPSLWDRFRGTVTSNPLTSHARVIDSAAITLVGNNSKSDMFPSTLLRLPHVLILMVVESYLLDVDTIALGASCQSMLTELKSYKIRKARWIGDVVEGGYRAIVRKEKKGSLLRRIFSSKSTPKPASSLFDSLYKLGVPVAVMISRADWIDKELLDKLPFSVRTIIFPTLSHDVRDEVDLSALKLPEGVIEVNALNPFVLISSISWPLSVTKLTLTNVFQRPLDSFVLPPRLKTLEFIGKDIWGRNDKGKDTKWSHVVLPDSLETLKIAGWSGMLEDLPTLPSSLLLLAVPVDFDLPLSNLKLPNGLTELDLNDHPSLMRSRRGPRRNQSHSPEGLLLPASLKVLKFASEFNHILDALTMPACLELLCFGDGFNCSLVGWRPPASLRELKFGSCWNHPLTSGFCMPPCLEVLELSSAFRQSLDDVTWPDTMRVLRLGTDFKASLANWNPPRNLTHLVLSTRWNHAVSKLILPPRLEVLEFGSFFNQSFQSFAFPPTLRVLRLGRDFNTDLSRVVLPPALEELSIGSPYSRSVFNHPLKLIHFPPHLRFLAVHSENLSVTRVVDFLLSNTEGQLAGVPSHNLTRLHVYSKHKDIYSAWLKSPLSKCCELKTFETDREI